MKKSFVLIGLLLLLGGTIMVVNKLKHPTIITTYAIGILQTASHPALDAVREGFTETLSALLHNDIRYAIQNAQGSVIQAQTIAQKFHADKTLNGVLSIATPATLAISAVEKEKPIFIAAITDPSTFLEQQSNICGTSDLVDVKAGVNLIKQLAPAAQKIGIIYTAGEPNSLFLAKQMSKELINQQLTPTDFTFSTETDIPATVESACRKMDALIAPTDNNVASAVSLISTIALKYKKPFIASDNMLIKFGPLAAQGVDYKECGNQTARIAYEVIVNGKKPSELPIQQAISEKIFVNQATLNALELKVPDALNDRVVYV